MELAAVAIGSLCTLWFIYMKNILHLLGFFFYLLIRYVSPTFHLTDLWLIGIFVLSGVRSAHQHHPHCVSAAAVYLLLSLLLRVWVPQAWGPGPCHAVPVFLWRTVMFLDQGLLQIGVFFPLCLEWSKPTVFHFAQTPQIQPPTVSRIHCRVLYPKDTENKCNTCGLRALLSKAWKLPECCL